jgi:hypothetical protein
MEWKDQAKQIADNVYYRNVLALVKQGIPFDVAFSLEWPEIVGWLVIFGEMEGREFSWSSMKWIER